jgi:HSP20 family protein
MSELILWKNQQMNKLRKDIDHLFNRFFSDFGVNLFPVEVGEGPSIEMSQTEDTLVIRAALPGVNPEDLDISVTSDSLTIRGKKIEESVENKGHYRRIETRSGSFSRTVPLPCRVKVDGIQATFKDGVLNMVMPKWGTEKARVKVEYK